jgi:putative heme-binding domain-containing protein
VPLAREERYDNLVFPRGGGPGSLAGRGGGPNVANGEKMFQQACASCHKFGTVGATHAPDLTGIGKTMLRRDILRSIFFPQEKVDARYESTVITTKDKQTVRGLVLSETAQNVVLKTTADAQPVTVVKTNIATRVKEKTSIMPDDLPDRVGDANIRDITVYLMGSGG